MPTETYQKLVQAHYRDEAKTHGLALTSTMADAVTRRMEIDNIIAQAKSGDRCLEVGCGNGAASVEIGKAKRLIMTCIDFSRDLIALAQVQATKDVRGSISFRQQDVLMLAGEPEYDLVFTQRCIINLLDWEDQKKALRRMALVAKPSGRIALIEAFTDGLQELNQARVEIGLSEIPPAYNNLHLDKEAVIAHLRSLGLVFQAESNFLSSYYFGTRVLYPALAKAGKTELIYNSAFAKFFAAIPPVGNFAHIKMLVFTKK